MSSSNWELRVVHRKNDKKYILPFDELVKNVLSQEQIDKIKIEALKEINKL